MLAVDQGMSAKLVDGAMFRGGHEPGTGILGNARLWPLLKRGNEGVLGQFLGDADVAYDARESGRSRAPTRSSTPPRWHDVYQ